MDLDLDPWALDPHHIFCQYVGRNFSWKLDKTEPSRLHHLQMTPILVPSFNFKTSSLIIKPQFPFEISKWQYVGQYVGPTSTLIFSKNTWNYFTKTGLSMYSIILNYLLPTKYQRKIPIMYYLRLKIRSEPHSVFQDGRPPPSCWHCTITYSEISCLLIFGLILVRLWHIFENVMSLHGDSLPKLGKPLEIANFSRFRLVMCIPITKVNVTIPVLFKTLINASPHPLPHHPPYPPYPNPLPPPFLAPPPCPFLQPLPPIICPPNKSKSAD